MDLNQYISSMNGEILRAHNAVQYNNLPGFLMLAEGMALMSLAENWPVDGDVVEIGSFKGKSTCFLAAGCRAANRGRVYAVDHFGGSPEHQKGGWEETAEIVAEGSTLPCFQKNVSAFGLGDRVEPLIGNSDELAARFSGQARLLFIDGEHSYEGTKRDYQSWEKFVPKHGVICFHDYQNNRYLDGVTKFIDDEIRPSARMKLLNQVGSLMVFVKLAA